MDTVNVGLVGAGFSAEFHVDALRRVAGIEVRIAGVASGVRERAAEFARRNGVAAVFDSYHDLLADPSIDVVCVCVPNALHAEIVIAAAEAGKHVICEKPIAIAAAIPPGASRARRELEDARALTDAIAEAVERSGIVFCYAENWVYAPVMAKTRRLLAAAGGAILDIRAEESHSGSHARATRRRATAGGGALLTLGAHPIAAALHLKQFEGELSGRATHVTSVTAEFAGLHEGEGAQSHEWIVSDWEDVETWANVVIGFADGSKAIVTASFAMLGGVRNGFEVYTTNAVMRSAITPNGALAAYSPDGVAFGAESLHEKSETRAGWNSVEADGDWSRGYPQEMQDFVEAVAGRRQPLSGLRLARDVIDVIYSSYVSADEGRRVNLDLRREGTT
jgi:predicted dehydrogenase